MPTYRLQTPTTARLFATLSDLRQAVDTGRMAWVYRCENLHRTLIATFDPTDDASPWCFLTHITVDERRALNAYHPDLFRIDLEQADPRYGLTPNNCYGSLAQASLHASTVPTECSIYRKLANGAIHLIARIFEGDIIFSSRIEDHEQRAITEALAFVW